MNKCFENGLRKEYKRDRKNLNKIGKISGV